MTSADRPPYVDPMRLDTEQQRVRDAIIAGPRGRMEAPLAIWLHSPILADRAQSLGAFCRYATSLAPRLSELAILITAAYWNAAYEWSVHAPIGLHAGLSQAVLDAVRDHRQPHFTCEDEAVVFDFSSELLQRHHVSQATYDRAVATLGLAATVELVGVLGYYGLISMTICAFEIPDISR